MRSRVASEKYIAVERHGKATDGSADFANRRAVLFSAARE
jgi:hypothetical protein